MSHATKPRSLGASDRLESVNDLASVPIRAGRPKSAVGRLLAGVALGAAALALSTSPQGLRAQAVQGTATVQFGASAPTYDPVTKTDTIFVDSGEALID